MAVVSEKVICWADWNVPSTEPAGWWNSECRKPATSDIGLCDVHYIEIVVGGCGEQKVLGEALA